MSISDVGKYYSDGAIIFRQGEVADCLYIIQSGNVVIYQENGVEEVPISELGTGDSFGDMGVFTGLKRVESARSLGGAQLITADYRFVLKKFRDDPSYAFQVIEKMAQRDLARKEMQDQAMVDLRLHHVELETGNRGADYYDFAPVGAIDLDENGVIRGINLSGATMLGADRRLLLGRLFATLVPPDDQDVFRIHLLECGRSVEGVITELQVYTRDGVSVLVQIFSYPKQNSDRVVYRTLMTELSSRQQKGDEHLLNA
jgi:PAS domain S-box-containing protein